MKKRSLAALVIALLAGALWLSQCGETPKELRFSIETDASPCALVVHTGWPSTRVRIRCLDDGGEFWLCGGDVTQILSPGSRYAVAVRSARPVRWTLRDEGTKSSEGLTKNP